jgi:hypothetical protein
MWRRRSFFVVCVLGNRQAANHGGLPLSSQFLDTTLAVLACLRFGATKTVTVFPVAWGTHCIR